MLDKKVSQGRWGGFPTPLGYIPNAVGRGAQRRWETMCSAIVRKHFNVRNFTH